MGVVLCCKETVACRKMDGSRGHHVKHNKPDRKNEHHVFSHTWDSGGGAETEKRMGRRALREREGVLGQERVVGDTCDQRKLYVWMKMSQ